MGDKASFHFTKVEVEDDFTSPLAKRHRRALRKVLSKAFPLPTVKTEGESLIFLTHATEEAALLSALTNRLAYGYDTSVEPTEDGWCVRVDVGTIEKLDEDGVVRYVWHRPSATA